MQGKPVCEDLEKVIQDLQGQLAKLKQNNDVLRFSEIRMKKIIQSSPIGLVISRMADGQILDVNESYLSICGYNREEVLGKTSMALNMFVNMQDREHAIHELQSQGIVRDFNCDIRRKSGQIRKVSLSVDCMELDGEECLVTHVIDITERKQAEVKLTVSTERLHLALEAAKAGTWEWDLRTNENIWSKELFSVYGLEPDSCKPSYEAWRQTIHPDDREKAEQVVQEAAQNGTVLNAEWRIVGSDGRERWLMSRGRPVRDAGGQPVRYFGVVMDITDRKQAEEKLRKSRELEQSILSSVPHGIFGLEDRKIFFANDAIEAVTGWKPEEVIGKDTRIFFRNDEEWRAYGAVIYAKMQSETTFSYEPLTLFVKKDGREMYCRTSFSRIGEYGSNKYVSMVEDVTEAKRTEMALRESERDFRLLVDNAPEAIFIQTGMRFAYVNFACMRLYGAGSREELLGMPVLERFAPDLHAVILKRIRLLHEENRPASAIEQKHLKMNGELIDVLVSAIPFRFQGDAGALVFVTDISGSKQMEEEKIRLQEQLLQAQKMESVGRLAGGVAHDFNNMLGVILGHTEMAMAGVEHDDPLWAGLEEIRKAAERSADLTRQLLAFARKQTISPKVLDPNETVEGMLKMLRRLIGEDMDLLWKPGHSVGQIRVDPSQIDQVLANLCVNARDAISGVGKVTIETGNVMMDDAYGRDHLEAAPGAYVMLAVSDDGSGMDKETLGKLFEPFYTTKEVGKGTGLGLATVYGIMKQNNGFINVYSEPNQGTTFKLYFPQYMDKTEQTRGEATQKPIQGGRETVLVVEDEPAILEMTKLMLEKQGYELLTARTPGEAIEIAGTYGGAIHLLITDVVMPEMNGRDLAAEILSFQPKIRKLFMSGYTADVIARHGVLEEGVHFIQKPFSLGDLAAKVREALDTD